jgi:hypothetical protein
MRKAVFFATVLGALAQLSLVGAAGAQAPIGPDQFFAGLVNGSSEQAVIRMACFGPIRPGQTGHPFAGQTVSVRGPLKSGPGFTGRADEITATLVFPSPVASTGAVVHLASFHSYEAPAEISTAVSFPCAGRGTVISAPVRGGPKAQAAKVSVSFVGQP